MGTLVPACPARTWKGTSAEHPGGSCSSVPRAVRSSVVTWPERVTVKAETPTGPVLVIRPRMMAHSP